jgi:hypothetical protein
MSLGICIGLLVCAEALPTHTAVGDEGALLDETCRARARLEWVQSRALHVRARQWTALSHGQTCRGAECGCRRTYAHVDQWISQKLSDHQCVDEL